MIWFRADRSSPAMLPLSKDASKASNVNVIDEMVDMITVARAYEAGQR